MFVQVTNKSIPRHYGRCWCSIIMHVGMNSIDTDTSWFHIYCDYHSQLLLPTPMLLPLVRHVSKPQSKQRCLAAWGRTISTTHEPHAYLRPLLTTTADAKLPELDRVMTLMLNRPATKNALTVQMVSVCALIICIASLCIILSMSFVCRRCVRPWPP